MSFLIALSPGVRNGKSFPKGKNYELQAILHAGACVRDAVVGTCHRFCRPTGETTRVSVDAGGVQGNENSEYPTISADGRYVVFKADTGNLVTGDTNLNADVFVRGPLVSFPRPMFLPAITHKTD